MDARVLHVTVVRPWGEKNGQDGDTRSPPSAPSPRLLSLGLFRENPGQGRDLFPLTDLRTRGPDVGPFAQTSPSRQCPLKIPFSPIEISLLLFSSPSLTAASPSHFLLSSPFSLSQ